jgi:hypothetical protein
MVITGVIPVIVITINSFFFIAHKIILLLFLLHVNVGIYIIANWVQTAVQLLGSKD